MNQTGVLTLIPAKAFCQSKQRLAGLLSAHERARLSASLLTRTIGTARIALGTQPIVVVTSDPGVAQTALAAGADQVFRPNCEGLNPHLAEAAAAVPALLGLPATFPLLVLHADLPTLAAADLTALCNAQRPVVIAPDHTGTGTNALLHRTAERFFAFGSGSCPRHTAEATRRGLTATHIHRPGLAHDLDDPTDWARMGATSGSQISAEALHQIQ